MYREHVLASRPYSYYTLDSGANAYVDLAGNGNTLSGMTQSNTAGSNFAQALVPGYLSSKGAATYTPAKSFGISGYESKAFSWHLWESLFNDNTGTTSDYTIMDQGSGKNIAKVDKYGIYVQFTATDPQYNVSLQYPLADDHKNKHIGVVWTGSAAALFVNGLLVDQAIVPGAFIFSNTTANITFSGTVIGHIAIFDRPLSADEMLAAYNKKNDIHSHAEACMNDGAEVFEMWTPALNYLDVIMDDELAGPGTINPNTDQYGWHTPRTIPPMVLSTGTAALSGSGITFSAGQYLAADVVNFLADSWVLAVNTNDDGTRGGNEYIWSLVSVSETLECYVTSGNVLTLVKTAYAGDGTSTATTYTYDTTVATANAVLVFLMDQGKFSAKTGASPTTLNTVSAATTINLTFTVTPDTQLLIGANADGTLSALPVIKTVTLHNQILSSAITGGSYDYYMSSSYSSAWWRLNNSLNGYAKQYLLAKPFIPGTDTIVCGYLKSHKSNGSIVSLVTTAGSTTTNDAVYPIPAAVIPHNGTVGGSIANQITSLSIDHDTDNSRWESQNPAVRDVTIRLFKSLKTYANRSDTYISFDGDGNLWLPERESLTVSRSGYEGAYFDSGTIGGAIVNPNVDGSTVRYSYRSIEFLVFVSSSPGTGRLISLFDGSTEYYFRVNGTAWDTNLSNPKINNQATIATSNAGLRGSWVHFYGEFPSLIQDHQLYVGKAYNGSSYATGVGIRNLATYDTVLTAAQRGEHYGCFVGRYSQDIGVIDSASYGENEGPIAYTKSWTNHVVPV